MGGTGDDKAKAQRDKAMAHLLEQYNATQAEMSKEIEILTSEMKPTVASSEVRVRIVEINKAIDKWVSMGILDPHTEDGELLFSFVAELKRKQSQKKFGIPLINDILADIATATQRDVADLQSWIKKLQWRAIESAMENTELFVDTAEVHSGENQKQKQKNNDEDNEKDKKAL